MPPTIHSLLESEMLSWDEITIALGKTDISEVSISDPWTTYLLLGSLTAWWPNLAPNCSTWLKLNVDQEVSSWCSQRIQISSQVTSQSAFNSASMSSTQQSPNVLWIKSICGEIAMQNKPFSNHTSNGYHSLRREQHTLTISLSVNAMICPLDMLPYHPHSRWEECIRYLLYRATQRLQNQKYGCHWVSRRRHFAHQTK